MEGKTLITDRLFLSERDTFILPVERETAGLDTEPGHPAVGGKTPDSGEGYLFQLKLITEPACSHRTVNDIDAEDI